MKVTYFSNNGRELCFKRDTFEQCIIEYQRRRKDYSYEAWIHGGIGANWGRVYINGERVWL